MKFAEARESLCDVYDKNQRGFDPLSGLPREELREYVLTKGEEDRRAGRDVQLIRAEMFAYLLDHARVGGVKEQLFGDSFDCEGILNGLRDKFQSAIDDPALRKLESSMISARDGWVSNFYPDYGHLCPDWRAILRLGIPGLISRLRETRDGKADLTPSQAAYYEACITAWEAIGRNIPRLAARCEAVGAAETAALLRPLAVRPPETFRECLQLIYLLFRLFEYVDGMRTRSLGSIDELLESYYTRDLQSGVPEEELADALRFFLFEFWTQRVPFDLPLCIGAPHRGDMPRDYTLTLRFIDIYSNLDIYSPKIHVRVAEDTPDEVLYAVCRSIRKGNSSFVFVCDETVRRSLERVGISPEDARDYLPIGCYEPGAFGTEIPCTGNGHVDLPRIIELTMNDGMDPVSGLQCGPHTGKMEDHPDFERFYGAFLAQLRYFSETGMELVRQYEKHYAEVYPIPLLSATYASSVENGVDALCGGAKYNNSSIYCYSIGSAADSMVVLREAYAGKLLTMEKLRKMLDANWEGYAPERKKLDRLPRYGNNQPQADELAVRMASDFADMTLGKPNGRGGVFKPANFTIDNFIRSGAVSGATPDGRRRGEPHSKNFCALAGKDREGVTALIQSAAKLPCDRYPNGSVLDVMLHPSAVTGKDGEKTMAGLVRTFFRMGGGAIHGNVMDAETLKKAQADPAAYATLQVRLCGWNVYFVNLTKAEQDDLIRAAETA